MTEPKDARAADARAAQETRLTPYDIVFGVSGFDESRLDVIDEQAQAAHVRSPGELGLLPEAGAVLHDLLPDRGSAEHAELFSRVTALLYHAWLFRRDGRHVYRLSATLLRSLLGDTTVHRDWTFRVPASAGYVQLERNVVWARVEEGAAAEPVDGFFWAAQPDSGRLDLLLALGVRRGRPGFSLVDVTVPLSADPAQWADVDARPDGVDFANILPGGELQNYHALTTHAEALKLVVRCFRALDTPAAAAQTVTENDNVVHYVDG